MNENELLARVRELENSIKQKDAYIEELEKLSEAYRNLSEKYDQELREANQIMKAQEMLQKLIEKEKMEADSVIQAHEMLQEFQRQEKEETVLMIEAHAMVSDLSVQELKERDSALRNILDVNRSITMLLDQDKLFQKILEKLMETLHTSRSVLFQFDQDELKTVAKIGIEEDEIRSNSFSRQHMMMEKSIRDRKPVIEIVEKSDKNEKFSFIMAPLIFENKLYGLLYSDITSSDFTLKENDLSIVEMFAYQSAISIYNSHLFGQFKKQNLELLKLMNMKNQFLSLLSDELISSSEKIIPFLSDAEIPGKSNEERMELIKKAGNLAHKMKGIIQKTWKMVSLGEGISDLFQDRIDFEELIREILGNHIKEKVEKNIEYKIQLSKAFHSFVGNRTILRFILDELITNSIFYNKKDGLVNILGSEDQTHLILKISDTGTGIQDKDLPHVFEQFYRSGESAEMNDKGAGLGLFMVKNSLKYYGGDISVKSEYGKGTEFTLTFLNH